MASDKKPRIFQDGRDIAINAVLIVVLMLVAVGATGLCSFNPGAPEQGPVQEVDAETFLDLESRAVDFPVRYPEMPDGWITNSARRSMLAGQPAPVVGWVTPDRGFIQLTQTGLDTDAAIENADSKPRTLDRTVDVDGHPVEVFASEEQDVRDVWVVDAGDARFVLTGAGEDREFEELIATALATAPIQHPDQ
ncbi:DUF4245 domain-containing protein [Corynebacterium ureicelerivorans]|uniref:DUF4245 domain-containing protein n=1 Tax=Corynebacterium ureicelerivorans TaxID=401472 RepID=UPI00264D56FF|nr:DUF4245 domain-containing protein [Corynebacterium ureicelerivorans]MDN8604661.1 DUF4245 domain-containing protein [Corynebacterium ureicelerivorans]